MFIVDKRKNEVFSLPAKEMKPEDANSIGSELAIKILRLLALKPMYPIEIAKELKLHEQKVYYHIHHLEKAGIIKVSKREDKQGASAKYYSLDKPSLVVRFKDLEPTQMLQLKSESEFLDPFVKDGELDAVIVVGSPDPHGPEKARSRDGYYGIDFALFLGTFLNYVPKFNVKLDIEVRESDLKKNMILIGGPIINSVTEKVNSKMPIRFEKPNWVIKSNISGKSYPQDEIGVIVKAKNPFNTKKSILLIAGKRFSGTRAAIIAFLKYFREISKGNIQNNSIKAKVVEGIDLDSDGIIDDVEFRE